MNDFMIAVLEKSYECRPCPADGSAVAKLHTEYEQLIAILRDKGCSEEVMRFLSVADELRQSERKAVYLGALITGITLHKTLSTEHQDRIAYRRLYRPIFTSHTGDKGEAEKALCAASRRTVCYTHGVLFAGAGHSPGHHQPLHRCGCPL